MDYSKSVGLNPKYNSFDLSHDKRMSLEMGKIVPVMALDVLPGDKFTMETSHLTRMLPLVSPVMHNVKVKVRYFFSPNRLVWDNWEDFITGPENATDTTEPVHPFIPVSGVPGELSDYMGIGTNSNASNVFKDVNALPFAHYQKIYQDYFRDQNLIDEDEAWKLTDGTQSATNINELRDIKTVAWQHDRFTSALPFTQKGPEVSLPVLGGDTDLSFRAPGQNDASTFASGQGPLTDGAVIRDNGVLAVGAGQLPSVLNNADSLYIDPTDVNAATVNQLREAFAIQKWLELNARSGNRYTEHIQAHFGVKPQDARLQRPEEFGGSVSNIQFSEVLQTSRTTTTGTDDSQLGQLGGHAVTASGSRKVSYYAQEHGWIFAMMYIVPDTAYLQGVPAKFNKIDRYDYFQPLLAHLGEQPVLNQEIWANGGAGDANTFGYLPIYDEYRHELNGVHGLLKTTLDYWHLGRKFSSRPGLDENFVTADPSNRIFVDEVETQQVIAHVYNDVKVQRKVPYYGTPMGI